MRRSSLIATVALGLSAPLAPLASPAPARQKPHRDPAPSHGGVWKVRSAMPVGAVFAGAVLGLDGRIFVISGSTGYEVLLTDAVRVYDPKRDAWTKAAPIPTSRTGHGTAVGSDGKLYVVGGRDRDRKQNVTEAYDPKHDAWTRLAPMPTPRDALCAVAAKGADGRVRIYAVGGRDRSKPGNGLSTVEAYDPATDTWRSQAPLPLYIHAPAATLGPDGHIYVVGGTNDRVNSARTMQVYDPREDAWTFGPPLPYGQECGAATFTPGPNGEVLVFGGWDVSPTHKRPMRRACAYCPRTGKWRDLPPAPCVRAAGGAVSLAAPDGGLRVYLVGGSPGETLVEEYSFRSAASSSGPVRK